MLTEMFGVKVDPEVAAAVKETGKALAGMGHTVETAEADIGGLDTLRSVNHLFFFAFDARLESYAKRTGVKIGPGPLEPVILSIYEWAKSITPAQFMGALAAANTARRKMARIFAHYDVMLSPTTSRCRSHGATQISASLASAPPTSSTSCSPSPVSSPCRTTSWARPPCRCRSPCTRPACPSASRSPPSPPTSTCCSSLQRALEQAMPWSNRMPPLHVSRM